MMPGSFDSRAFQNPPVGGERDEKMQKLRGYDNPHHDSHSGQGSLSFLKPSNHDASFTSSSTAAPGSPYSNVNSSHAINTSTSSTSRDYDASFNDSNLNGSTLSSGASTGLGISSSAASSSSARSENLGVSSAATTSFLRLKVYSQILKKYQDQIITDGIGNTRP